MNSAILCGRLTKDPEVRYGQGSGIAIARYTLAVDRRVVRKEGDPTTDYISCITFGRGAEFAEKYLKKGTKILVEGHIQTGSYTNREGHKVYTTDVAVETHEFVEPRGTQQAPQPQEEQYERATVAPMGTGFVSNNTPRQTTMDDFMPIPDDVADEGLPFA